MLYRSAERELEIHQMKHEFRLGEYGKSADPQLLLAENVARIYMAVHQSWTQLVPNPEKVKEAAIVPAATPTRGKRGEEARGATVRPARSAEPEENRADQNRVA
jgi:hypothetical protein